MSDTADIIDIIDSVNEIEELAQVAVFASRGLSQSFERTAMTCFYDLLLKRIQAVGVALAAQLPDRPDQTSEAA